MSDLTSFDWWLATYLVAAGFGFAFYVGQLIVKLLLIRFASHKRIDDGLWKPECWMHIQDVYPLTGEIIHRQYLFKPNGIKRASHGKLSVYHPIAEFF